MDDPQVYLEKLSAFSRILRMEGLPVSLKETEDGAHILMELGLQDRETVKTALRTVFAKSREEQKKFDAAFDGFFLSEEAIREQARQRAQQQQEQDAQRQQARQELEDINQRVNLDETEQVRYQELPQESRQKLQDFLNRYKGNVDRSPQLYSEFIHSVFAKTMLEQQMLLENAGIGAEKLDPELGILCRDIGAFRDTEIPKAIQVIQTVARQINGELSAKRRGSASGGQLDFRRTIRGSLSAGGSLHKLYFRKKHARKRRLVILCDVSGSMVQFSEFALRFIQSLNQTAESSRIYLFSETIVEADAFQLQNMDRFRDTVRSSGIYGRGTDLGLALQTLCAAHPPVLNNSTTLLILSDTKTVDTQRALSWLREAKRQSARILWLNPIPERNWKYIKSVAAVQTLCPMIPCSTLGELAGACRKLLA